MCYKAKRYFFQVFFLFFLYQLLFLKATTVFHTCVLCEKFDYVHVLGTRFETVPILELLP